jgi:hypothetical protein
VNVWYRAEEPPALQRGPDARMPESPPGTEDHDRGTHPPGGGG